MAKFGSRSEAKLSQRSGVFGPDLICAIVERGSNLKELGWDPNYFKVQKSLDLQGWFGFNSNYNKYPEKIIQLQRINQAILIITKPTLG